MSKRLSPSLEMIMSHDIEDVIAVVDGRLALMAEVMRAQEQLKAYLAQAFMALLADADFMQALPGFLPSDSASQARLPLVTERLRRLASLT